MSDKVPSWKVSRGVTKEQAVERGFAKLARETARLARERKLPSTRGDGSDQAQHSEDAGDL